MSAYLILIIRLGPDTERISKAAYIASYLNRRLNASSLRGNLYAEGFTSNKSFRFVFIPSATIEIGHIALVAVRRRIQMLLLFFPMGPTGS